MKLAENISLVSHENYRKADAVLRAAVPLALRDWAFRSPRNIADHIRRKYGANDVARYVKWAINVVASTYAAARVGFASDKYNVVFDNAVAEIVTAFNQGPESVPLLLNYMQREPFEHGSWFSRAMPTPTGYQIERPMMGPVRVIARQSPTL